MELKEKQESSQLSDIDVVEVSLVGSPANKRRFLLIKNKEGEMSEDIELTEEEQQIEEVKKALSESDQNAIKGAMKMLGKVEAAKDILKKLATLVPGYGEPKEGAKDKEDYEYPEPKKKGKTEKSEAQLESIQKERDELKDRVEKAETKVAGLQKAERTRQLREIAKTLSGDIEENFKYLETLAESLPQEKFDSVVKREQAQAKRLAESKAFEEIGSSRPSPGSAFEKLTNLVNDEVTKSADHDPIKAWDRIIKAHPELYDEYTKEQKKSLREEH